jgi:hypothetical protein
MSVFKGKLKKDIVAPAEHIRRSYNMIATVTSIDEKNNFCSIQFIDKDGYRSNKNNVPVALYNASIIDWFPQVGELVNVEQIGELTRVVSKYEGAYGANTRANIELKKDINASTFTNTMAGSIF